MFAAQRLASLSVLTGLRQQGAGHRPRPAWRHRSLLRVTRHVYEAPEPAVRIPVP